MNRTAQAAEALRRKKSPQAFPGASGDVASDRDILSTGPLEGPKYVPELPAPQPHEVAAAAQALEEEKMRPSSVPAQVSQAMMGAASQVVPQPLPQVDDDAAIDAAREADRQSRFAAGMELAGRQLVGGITRTPVPQGLGANPSEVPLAMARAKSKREQAAELLRQQRQEAIDASTLDLQKSQAEKNRREPGDVPMTPWQATQAEDRDLDREARLADQKRKAEEAERRRAAAVAALREKKSEKAKEAGIAAESSRFPALGGMFSPRPGTKPDPTVARQTMEKAGLYNAAVAGMNDLEGAVRAYIANPGPATKRAVDAKVAGVAAATNAAHGGGAMANDEFERQRAGMGADPTSVAALQAMVEQAFGAPGGAETLVGKLASTRQSLSQMGIAKFKAANYDFTPDTARTGKASPGPGYTRGKFGDKSGWYNAKTNDWVAD